MSGVLVVAIRMTTLEETGNCGTGGYQIPRVSVREPGIRSLPIQPSR